MDDPEQFEEEPEGKTDEWDEFRDGDGAGVRKSYSNSRAAV